MEFKKIVEKIIHIKNAYKKLNEKRWEKIWTASSYTQWFVWDVGNLCKLVMAKEWYRTIENVDSKIIHELLDCLFSIISIADELDIDLEKEFNKVMNELEDRVKEVNGEYKENL